jgi:hypothetical protein
MGTNGAGAGLEAAARGDATLERYTEHISGAQQLEPLVMQFGGLCNW